MADSEIDLEILAFGAHLESSFGYTMDEVKALAANVTEIHAPSSGDSPLAMLKQSAGIISAFSDHWTSNLEEVDWVIALGDRFEMFAAVQSAFAFGLRIAHFHGGETTEGALDNAYRHSISHMSDIHFTSHDTHSKRLASILGTTEGIHTVGSMSLDNLDEVPSMDKESFQTAYGLDLNKPTAIVTLHPVTKAPAEHDIALKSLCTLIKENIDIQFLITLPNIDPGHSTLRDALLRTSRDHEHVFALDSLGKEGYFSAMKNALMLIGNSSSALIESASFGIYAINMGSRQSGRTANPNVVDCGVFYTDLRSAFMQVKDSPTYSGPNEFNNPRGAARESLEILMER
jgi:GDP/UDP-N,N'-diacetylbacillosamine 2-epimerase (hydrolysing)